MPENFGGVHRAGISSICYTCTCGGTHRAGISSVRCTCACHEYIVLAQAVSYAAPSEVLKHFAFAPAAYAAPLRLQQIASVISLLCPPSAHSPVVKYIAPAPAVYAVLVPVVVYIAPAQSVSWAAPAQVLDYLAPAPLAYAAHIATTTSGFGSLPVVPTSILAPVVQYIAPTPGVRCTCACHEYIAPAQQFLTPCQLKYLST